MGTDLIHSELSDYDFRTQFEECTLNPTVFCHEAHLRLAWIHINKYGLEQAKENIQIQLQSFVEHVGAKDKYHKTLTIVAIQMVNYFKDRSKSNTFDEFIKEFPQLKDNFRELIENHYSFDIFNSVIAKKEYLEPDVLFFE